MPNVSANRIVFALLISLSCMPRATEVPAAGPVSPGKATTMDNPFFEERWTTPYGAPPFERILEDHYGPAFEQGMADHLQEIETIANADASPTFDNTIVALERSGALLTRVAQVFFNLSGSTTTDGLQKIRAEFAPKLAQHQDRIVMNRALFKRVVDLYEQREALGLDSEQVKLIEDYHRDFVRAGANLEGDARTRVSEINTRLATLYTEVSEALRRENNYLLVIDNKKDLAGLPPEVSEAGRALAEERGHAGAWAFTLVRSSFEPFMTYARDRTLRKKLHEAFHRSGSHGNENDTRAWAKEIAMLRAERANLKGFPNHAAYTIDGNMAGTPEAVYALMNQLLDGSRKRLLEDRAELQKLLQADVGTNAKLEPWDWRYYAEQLRKRQFDLSEEELKPYFQLDAVREGAFDTASRLFGITFEEVTGSVPSYHPDVKAFDVKNQDGSHVGLLYVDYFARANKRSGAWMSVFREQRNLDEVVRPVVVNVGNFPTPAADKPALLGWSEVVTLFHEFGHALHGLMSDVTYPRFAGTSVKRDYVEFPSQLLENWASTPAVLKRYAKHHATGESIPDALLEKLRNSSKFNQGFETGEYVAAALLDLAWHTKTVDELAQIEDVNAFDQATMQEIGMIPEVPPRYYSPYFQHIFTGDGYASGYYVYGWAQVLEADAFAAFEATGDAFNPELSQKLREYIFAAGSSREEMQLYLDFRGQQPSVEALLEKRGLTDG